MIFLSGTWSLLWEVSQVATGSPPAAALVATSSVLFGVMALVDVKTKAVGPYVLDRTLGRGQTGKHCHLRCNFLLFAGPAISRIGETWYTLQDRSTRCCENYQQEHVASQNPAKGERMPACVHLEQGISYRRIDGAGVTSGRCLDCYCLGMPEKWQQRKIRVAC
jgi:hypothetical protein